MAVNWHAADGALISLRALESREPEGVGATIMRLDQWIDERHLQPAAIASYAAAYASVPYASVAIDNFLTPAKFTALQRVFSVEGQFAEKHFLWGWVNGRTK